MLALNSLGVKLAGRSIIRGLSFNLPESELVAIIGANGAGKSTLLKTISGELRPASGDIHILDKPRHDWDVQKLAQVMAVLPQSSQLNFPFLVEDVVSLGRMPHSTGKIKDAQIVQEVMARMDILSLRDKPYTQLSGGEKQRVQLARVLAQISRVDSDAKKLLLLDEPVSALDIAHQHSLMALLQEIKATNVCIVMVLHDFNLAAQYADKLISLHEGELAAFGMPDEVLTPDHLKKVFNVEVSVLRHPTTGRPIIAV